MKKADEQVMAAQNKDSTNLSTALLQLHANTEGITAMLKRT